MEQFRSVFWDFETKSIEKRETLELRVLTKWKNVRVDLYAHSLIIILEFQTRALKNSLFSFSILAQNRQRRFLNEP